MRLNVGLDFGNTKCAVTRVRKGRPEALDLDGSIDGVVPSVVWYQEGSAAPLVGARAENESPARAIRSLKPLLGRDLSSAEGSTAASLQLLLRERQLSPEDVAAHLFRFLREKTIEEVGEPPASVVLTVPAYAPLVQREATRRAAQTAGWSVSQLLVEPVAAGIAYLHLLPELDASRPQRLVVYDLGGGTFDFAALEYEPSRAQKDSTPTFRVYAKFGDPKLGGDKFDQIIFEQAMKPHLGEPLGRARERSETDLLDYEWIGRLKAREAKHRLSAEDESPLTFAPGRGEKVWNLPPLRRAQFEEWIAPQVSASLEQVDGELGRIGWRTEDMTAVLLVGGGTRVPYIGQQIVERFGMDKIRSVQRLDLMVALGAAVVAHEGIKPIVEDVLARSVSLRPPKDPDACVRFLSRGIPLREAKRPLTCQWQSDTATSVALDLCLGESERWALNEFLGRVVVSSPQPLPRGTKVLVDLRMAEEGDRVEATARVVGSDRPLDVNVETRQAGGAKVTGSVALEDRPAVDIAVVIDGTGSMRYRRRSLIPDVVACCERMASDLESAGMDVAFAVARFGDSTNGSCVKVLPFAPGADLLTRRANGLRECEGGPESEPVFRALRETFACLCTARPDSARWLILVTDAPSRDQDDEVAQWLEKERFRVVITAPQQHLYSEAYDKLAVATRGKYFDVAGELGKSFNWVVEQITGREAG